MVPRHIWWTADATGRTWAGLKPKPGITVADRGQAHRAHHSRFAGACLDMVEIGRGRAIGGRERDALGSCTAFRRYESFGEVMGLVPQRQGAGRCSRRPVDGGAPLTLDTIEVIAPNLKRRLSGRHCDDRASAPGSSPIDRHRGDRAGLPAHVPCVPLWSVVTMSGRTNRVWHARRNTEMLLGLVLRHVLRKRLKLVFTSASQRCHTRYTRWLISRMDAVVATSRRTASYLRRPSQVIPHGIDTETFRPTPDRTRIRRSLGLPDPLITIGCFGRIRHQKGTDVFVNAMLEVLPNQPDMTALVMGRATGEHEPFLRSLRKTVCRPGLSTASCSFRRFRYTKCRVGIRRSTCSLLLSDGRIRRHSARGHGMRRPGHRNTTVGAFDELVVEGRTGRLVPPGDVERMRCVGGCCARIARHATGVVAAGPATRRSEVSNRGRGDSAQRPVSHVARRRRVGTHE